MLAHLLFRPTHIVRSPSSPVFPAPSDPRSPRPSPHASSFCFFRLLWAPVFPPTPPLPRVFSSYTPPGCPCRARARPPPSSTTLFLLLTPPFARLLLVLLSWFFSFVVTLLLFVAPWPLPPTPLLPHLSYRRLPPSPSLAPFFFPLLYLALHSLPLLFVSSPPPFPSLLSASFSGLPPPCLFRWGFVTTPLPLAAPPWRFFAPCPFLPPPLPPVLSRFSAHSTHTFFFFLACPIRRRAWCHGSSFPPTSVLLFVSLVFCMLPLGLSFFPPAHFNQIWESSPCPNPLPSFIFPRKSLFYLSSLLSASSVKPPPQAQSPMPQANFLLSTLKSMLCRLAPLLASNLLRLLFTHLFPSLSPCVSAVGALDTLAPVLASSFICPPPPFSPPHAAFFCAAFTRHQSHSTPTSAFCPQTLPTPPPLTAARPFSAPLAGAFLSPRLLCLPCFSPLPLSPRAAAFLSVVFAFPRPSFFSAPVSLFFLSLSPLATHTPSFRPPVAALGPAPRPRLPPSFSRLVPPRSVCRPTRPFYCSSTMISCIPPCPALLLACCASPACLFDPACVPPPRPGTCPALPPHTRHFYLISESGI